MSKLRIELVPKGAWGSNLRSALPRATWDSLRHAAYAKAKHRCQVCGQGNTRLHCHEVWHYDDSTHVQTLMELVALCPACHEVKHFGLAKVKARGQEALEHLAKVNDITLEQAQVMVGRAFAQWRERSRHEWKLVLPTDFGLSSQ